MNKEQKAFLRLRQEIWFEKENRDGTNTAPMPGTMDEALTNLSLVLQDIVSDVKTWLSGVAIKDQTEENE